MPLYDLGKETLLVGRKVRDKNEGQARMGIEVFEDLFKGLQSARGGAKSDHRIHKRGQLLLPGFIFYGDGQTGERAIRIVVRKGFLRGIPDYANERIVKAILLFGLRRYGIIGLGWLHWFGWRLVRTYVLPFMVFHGVSDRSGIKHILRLIKLLAGWFAAGKEVSPGAEAGSYFEALAARQKSCPDAKHGAVS
jgi:hypothetical protein